MLSFLIACSLAFYSLEPQTALDAGTSMWWTIETVSTVGYGDVVPQTTAGRILGSLVMFMGVGIFGYLAGSASAWFEEEEKEGEASEIEELNALVRQVLARLEGDETNVIKPKESGAP